MKTNNFISQLAAGQRIWLSFKVFEIGSFPIPLNSLEEDNPSRCDSQQDHVSIDLGNDSFSPNLTLCGNLTSRPYWATFISATEKLIIRVHAPIGKTGRGFLGRFKAVPGELSEKISTQLYENSSIRFTSLNFPLDPPTRVSLTTVFTISPNYIIVIRLRGNILPLCELKANSYVEIVDPYNDERVGNGGTKRRKVVCDPQELQDHVGTNSGSVPASTEFHNKNAIDVAISSSFNSLHVKQVYRERESNVMRPRRWNAQVVTSLGMYTALTSGEYNLFWL